MKQYIPGIVGVGLILICIGVMTAMGIVIGDAIGDIQGASAITTSEKKNLPHVIGFFIIFKS